MTVIKYKSEQTFKCDWCGEEAVSGDMPPDKWYTLTNSQIDQRDQEQESGIRVVLLDSGGHFCTNNCIVKHLKDNIKDVKEE